MVAPSLTEAFCDEFSTVAPFDRIDRSRLRALAAQAELAYFPVGSIISHAEQDATQMYLIKDGRVGGNGAEADVPEYHKGDVFPVDALLTGQKPTVTLEAIEDSFVYLFPVATFESLRQDSAAFADYCVDRLGHLLVRSQQALHANLALDSRHTALSTLLGQIMSKPVTCLPETPLREALAQMHAARIGSMLVADAAGQACGIYTLQDLLGTVLSGADLDSPISVHMCAPLRSLPPDALAADAAVLMARYRIRHIPVLEQNRLLGMVSERDLYGLQRVSLGSIERQLEQARTPGDFAEAAARIRQLSINLLAQGLAAEPLARLTSTLLDRLTAQLLALHLEPLRRSGIKMAWLVFGSEGRQEQTFATDQDNGIVFIAPEGQSEESVRDRLLPLCREVNEILDRCGISLCKGGIMAMNPACNLSLAQWQARFGAWVDGGDAEDLLAATIYFDFRVIWGDESLGDALHTTLQARIRERPRFLWLLARNALRFEPPLGLIREFVTQKHDGRAVIDLKTAGTVFFIDAARILALAAGVRSVATSERLRQAGELLDLPKKRVDSWINAFQFLQMLRLHLQERQISQGKTPDNLVVPEQLTALERRILHESLAEARWLQRSITQRWPA